MLSKSLPTREIKIQQNKKKNGNTTDIFRTSVDIMEPQFLASSPENYFINHLKMRMETYYSLDIQQSK